MDPSRPSPFLAQEGILLRLPSAMPVTHWHPEFLLRTSHHSDRPTTSESGPARKSMNGSLAREQLY